MHAENVGYKGEYMETLSLLGMLGICSVEDVKKKQIHLFFVLVFGIIGVFFHLFNSRLSIYEVLGGMGVGGVVYLLSYFTKEKIGKGDALILTVTGIYLGFWENIMLLWMSAVCTSIVGFFVVIIWKKGREFELPFSPFLFVSCVGLMILRGGLLGA